mgnify:CR=1 FL=1
MPKLKHQPNEQTPELDLTDEATVQELLNADVLKPNKDEETKAAEKAIKQLKPVKVTLALSPAENAQLTRMASVKNVSVEEFLLAKIHELFLDSNVGQPLISAPSNLSGSAVAGKKISGPTGIARRSS